MRSDYQKCIILGAPRSGTNMLRDVLAELPRVSTWPCDEINYIWRHGNVRYPSDELPAALARTSVSRYVNRQFDLIGGRYRANVVVEKTCANSLRVPFVDTIAPEAKFVFIRRDGLDAVASALHRWKAPLDIPYLLQKVRFVPPSDLPYYGVRYLWHRLYRLLSSESRVAMWGPKLDGMSEILSRHPLDEVCALQWQRCIESSADSLALLPGDRWIEVAYEEFVRSPVSELTRIIEFLGIQVPVGCIRAAVEGVRSDSIGKGRIAFGDDAVKRLEALVSDSLVRFGYA